MTAAAARVGRFYTAARRHPWVLGKVADWKIPFGPYTPAQIAVAVGGGFLLVKTIGWWSWMGPVPLIAWVLVIWMVRTPKIGGRAPMQGAVGWVLLAWQPRGGRIGARAARDRASHPLLGGFTIEAAPGPAEPTASSPWKRGPGSAPHPRPAAERSPAPRPAQPDAAAAGPTSGVQQLLERVKQGGAQ
ncbi:hypothetical protein [Streptomyces crystallinus]|uniref:Uncharacterized protein n=1 Tax=Streptomyces crystallinus TaxID=68191 RepID=A0ABP3RPN5_9ACTN